MPLVAQKVWTRTRRLMGNFIPAIIALPFGIAGILLFDIQKPFWGVSFWLLVAFVAVGWVAVCLFGLYQNLEMRAELARRLDRAHEGRNEERYFVGIARPKYRSILDAHEDVGFIIVQPERLDFFGDTLHLEILKSTVREIRFRANPHSWVGLGRWVSVEGTLKGNEFRLLMEPRESATLLGNLRRSRDLCERLQTWLKNE